MDGHYPWRRGPGRIRWHPDGTESEGYSIIGAAEYNDLLDLLQETRPFEIGSWLDRRYVDKWVVAAALRALQEDCLHHPLPSTDPGCPRCVHNAVLERCARILTGEHVPHSPARPELRPYGSDGHGPEPVSRQVPRMPPGSAATSALARNGHWRRRRRR
jgi:hypothetical protein